MNKVKGNRRMLIKLIKIQQSNCKTSLLTFEQPEKSFLTQVRNFEISICSLCPYFKRCEYYPDPRNAEDRSKTFKDFCEDQDNIIELTMYPQEGSIEKLGYYITEVNQ